VLPDPEFKNTASPAGMVVRRQTFERLLAFLSESCDVLTLSGDAPDWQGRSTRSRIAVTFDDGWKDTAEIALPLLEKYSIPATVFVCPGLTGKVSPFWPEQITRAWRAAAQNEILAPKFAAKCNSLFPANTVGSYGEEEDGLDELIAGMKDLPSSKRDSLVRELSDLTAEDSAICEPPILEATMTWEETKAIRGNGMQIGSHSQHHEILTRLTLDPARSVIADSKRAIESHLGHPCLMFAYPNGSWSVEIRGLVVQQGYTQAFVNSPGVWSSKTDPWLIPRVNLWEGSLTDGTGNFSSLVFRYTTFWRAYRAEARKRKNKSAGPAS